MICSFLHFGHRTLINLDVGSGVAIIFYPLVSIGKKLVFKKVSRGIYTSSSFFALTPFA
jgi:hypothetical protein